MVPDVTFDLAVGECRMTLALDQREAFGIFCTLFRSQPFRKDDSMSEAELRNARVHGCIGWWSTDLQPVDCVTLMNRLTKVAHDAAYDDDRRHGWKRPFDSDAAATIEISLMLTPLRPLSTEHFDPTVDGLMLLDSNGKTRATFLPKVFDRTVPLNQIVKALERKAVTSSSGSSRMYTYRTLETSATLDVLIFDPKALTAIRERLVTTILRLSGQMNDSLVPPYSVTANRAVAYRDPTSRSATDVRNMATICDLITVRPSLTRVYRRYVIETVSEARSVHDSDTVAVLESFGLLAVRDNNNFPIRWRRTFDRLRTISSDFVRAQVTLNLALTASERDGPLLSSDEKDDDDDWIWAGNWELQARQALRMRRLGHVKHKSQSVIVRRLGEPWYSAPAETNRLVVMFEILCHLSGHSFDPSALDDTEKKRAKDLLLWTWTSLNRHRLTPLGLYAFSFQGRHSGGGGGGGEARVDLSGHVISGLSQLLPD